MHKEVAKNVGKKKNNEVTFLVKVYKQKQQNENRTEDLEITHVRIAK